MKISYYYYICVHNLTKNLLASYVTMSEYKARKGSSVKEERPLTSQYESLHRTELLDVPLERAKRPSAPVDLWSLRILSTSFPIFTILTM